LFRWNVNEEILTLLSLGVGRCSLFSLVAQLRNKNVTDLLPCVLHMDPDTMFRTQPIFFDSLCKQLNSSVLIIKKNEMGGACSAYGGEERCIQGFGGETGGKKTTWGTQA